LTAVSGDVTPRKHLLSLSKGGHPSSFYVDEMREENGFPQVRHEFGRVIVPVDDYGETVGELDA
jgi:hypothetical protein